jgi:hypothetical protein
MEGAGISLHGLGFLLVWWKKLGPLWTTALLIAVSAPVGGCSYLSYATAHSVPDWIGDFGVQFDARDWTIHPLSLSAEAHDVTLRRDEHSDPVFTAASVEFDGSVGTLLSGFFTSGAAYNEITIRHGEVKIEQSLTGDWNWAGFIAAVPEARRQAALKGLYEIRQLRLDDLRIVYTEHVPGQSGGGVIQTAQATIYFDAVNGSITDFVRAVEPDDKPTRVELRARTADGIVELTADAAFFADEDQRPADQGRLVRTAAEVPAGAASREYDGPPFSLRLYLENIGAGAYARMVPTTRIVPVKGTLRGTLELASSRTDGITCRSAFAVDDVQFAPNPKLVPARHQYDAIERELQHTRVSDGYDLCTWSLRPPGRDGRARRVGGSELLAAFNVETTKTAPVGVRAIAALDQHSLTGSLTSSVMADLNQQLGVSMSREVTRLLGAQSGRAIEQAFAANGLTLDGAAGSEGNAVASGVKSLGRGIRRLFGGGNR